MILVMGILGSIGAVLLIIGNGHLEKINAFFNKAVFSVGPAIKKGDENVVEIDNWLMKRSRVVGVAALIISVFLIVNLYVRLI